jgi:hypothetical protein
MLVYPIPEPSTHTLIGMGGLGIFVYAWKKRKSLLSMLFFGAE